LRERQLNLHYRMAQQQDGQQSREHDHLLAGKLSHGRASQLHVVLCAALLQKQKRMPPNLGLWAARR
jgi:hypothetical protein